jgi:hypothetical protein
MYELHRITYLEIIPSLTSMFVPLKTDQEKHVSIYTITFKLYRSSSEAEFIFIYKNNLKVL